MKYIQNRMISLGLALSLILLIILSSFPVIAQVTNPPYTYSVTEMKTKLDSLQTKPIVNTSGKTGQSYTGDISWSVEGRYNYTSDQRWNSISSTKYVHSSGDGSLAPDATYLTDGWACDAAFYNNSYVSLIATYNTCAVRLNFSVPNDGVYKIDGDSVYPYISAPSLINGNDTYNNAFNSNKLKFRITLNGNKIWPSDKDYTELSVGDQINFPTLENLNLSKLDKISFELFNPFTGYNTIGGGHSATADVYVRLLPQITLTAYRDAAYKKYNTTELRQSMITTLSGRYGQRVDISSFLPWVGEYSFNGGAYTPFSHLYGDLWGGTATANPPYIQAGHGTGDAGVAFMQYGGTYPMMITSSVRDESTTLSFVAPSEGTYKISSNSDYSNIDLITGNLQYFKDNDIVKFKINVNGSKIWPLDKDYAELTKTNASIAFPIIDNLGLRTGDKIQFELASNNTLGWLNQVILSPFVERLNAQAVNSLPIASDSMITVNAGKPFQGAFRVTDTDGDTLTYEIVDNPKHGTVAVTATGYVYTANIDYLKDDSFTYKAYDGKGYSKVATVAVYVMPKDHKIYDPNTLRATANTIINGRLDTLFPITQGTEWRAQHSLNGAEFTDYTNVKASNWGARTANDPAFVFFAEENKNSGVGFQDQGGLDPVYALAQYENEKVALAFIAPETGFYSLSASDKYPKINIPKSYIDNNYYAGFENEEIKIKITVNGVEIWYSGNEQATKLSANNPSINMPVIPVTLRKGDVLQFEVENNPKLQWLTSVFMYPQITLMNIVDFNVEPAVYSDEIIAKASVGYHGAFNGSDINNNPLTYEIVERASHGTVQILENGKYIYTANADYTGKDFFTYRAFDGEYYSKPAQISITVMDKNYSVFDPLELRKQGISANKGQLDKLNVYQAIEPWIAEIAPINDSFDLAKFTVSSCWSKTVSDPDFVYFSNNLSTDAMIGYQSYQGITMPMLSPQTSNSKVSLSFAAQISGKYSIKPSEKFSRIELPSSYLEKGYYKGFEREAVKFRITVNDKKIWPTDNEYLLLSANEPSYQFPALDLDVKSGDVIRFEAYSNNVLGWKAGVFFYPEIILSEGSKLNEKPVVKNQELYVDMNSSISGKLFGRDGNGDDLTFIIKTQPKNGTASINAKTGEFTYTPKKEFKGTDTFAYMISDGKAFSDMGTITIETGFAYDSVQMMTDIVKKNDKNLTHTSLPLIQDDNIFRWQYTHTDVKGSTTEKLQYLSTQTAQWAKSGEWEGFIFKDETSPEICIQDFEGSKVLGIKSGDRPIGKDPVGAVAFYAPNDGVFRINANSLCSNIKLFGSSVQNNVAPIKIWISKNGKKIWPVDKEAVELTKTNIQVAFPNLKVAMKKNDVLRVNTQGSDLNKWYNDVAVYPMVYDIGTYDATLDPNTESDVLPPIQEEVVYVVDEGNIDLMVMQQGNIVIETETAVKFNPAIFKSILINKQDIEIRFKAGTMIVPYALAEKMFVGSQDIFIYGTSLSISDKIKQLAGSKSLLLFESGLKTKVVVGNTLKTGYEVPYKVIMSIPAEQTDKLEKNPTKNNFNGLMEVEKSLLTLNCKEYKDNKVTFEALYFGSVATAYSAASATKASFSVIPIVITIVVLILAVGLYVAFRLFQKNKQIKEPN